VVIDALDLHYYSNPNKLQLKRPFNTDPGVLAAVSTTDNQLNQGME
jgi:hypothetical protein